MVFVYHFRTPDSISNGLRESKVGPYGPPNADFDWCEYNYETFFYVAEPINTLTGFFFIIQSIVFLVLHKDIPISLDIYNMHFWVFLVGIGTCLFHATLRYRMQLIDEMPMVGIVVFSSCWFLKKRFGNLPYKIAAPTLITLYVILLISAGDREGNLHKTSRLILTLLFACGFINVI